MIDRRHVPPALNASPLSTELHGDIAALERYVRSGRAARHWDLILHEHQQRLRIACAWPWVSWAFVPTVWHATPAVWQAALQTLGEEAP